MQNSTVCSHGVQNPEPCPTGYYCPVGTNYSSEYPCPNGTFNSQTTKEQVSDCVSCTQGKYCGSEGLSAVSGDCDPGYYCIGGAADSNPTDGTTGNVCPAGSYCPAGSFEPEECPAGTYNPDQGTIVITVIYTRTKKKGPVHKICNIIISLLGLE